MHPTHRCSYSGVKLLQYHPDCVNAGCNLECGTTFAVVCRRKSQQVAFTRENPPLKFSRKVYTNKILCWIFDVFP